MQSRLTNHMIDIIDLDVLMEVLNRDFLNIPETAKYMYVEKVTSDFPNGIDSTEYTCVNVRDVVGKVSSISIETIHNTRQLIVSWIPYCNLVSKDVELEIKAIGKIENIEDEKLFKVHKFISFTLNEKNIAR